MQRLSICAFVFLSWAHLGLLVCMFCPESSKADLILVDDYTRIAGRSFLDLPTSSDVLAPWTIDDLTITATHVGNFGFFAWATVSVTPSDPGSGAGFIKWSPVTLDFSTPLAAFGVTFNRWTASYPATLEVFDGEGGAGNLLGSISCAPYSYPVSQDNPPQDFVGLWSSTANIRSAVMYGSGPENEFHVDGYGFSFTPAPEPGIIALSICGLASFGLRRRRTESWIDSGGTG